MSKIGNVDNVTTCVNTGKIGADNTYNVKGKCEADYIFLWGWSDSFIKAFLSHDYTHSTCRTQHSSGQHHWHQGHSIKYREHWRREHVQHAGWVTPHVAGTVCGVCFCFITYVWFFTFQQGEYQMVQLSATLLVLMLWITKETLRQGILITSDEARSQRCSSLNTS